MRGPVEPDEEERFLARVAWAYHVEGLTQGEVAARLGVTRLRVNRALTTARRSGFVRVTFDTRFTACLALEERLKARFGLKGAYVAPSPGDPEAVQATVGAALGHLLSEVLADPGVRLFGMSWGNTLNIATRHVAPLDRPDLEIVSVMGGLSKGSELDSFDITRRLAMLCGARRRHLTAPLYAGSAESRDIIMGLDVFVEVLDLIRRADAIAMAAGDLSARSMLMRDGLPADVTVASLRERGAVGDLLGTVLDADGRPIDHPINDRVIGIGLDDLRRIPNVILAAGGAHKAPIVRAALEIGVVGTLVTDEATAALALGDDP
jgi:DNA-binding transcriptional regulator LsrR (DeoR family)